MNRWETAGLICKIVGIDSDVALWFDSVYYSSNDEDSYIFEIEDGWFSIWEPPAFESKRLFKVRMDDPNLVDKVRGFLKDFDK